MSIDLKVVTNKVSYSMTLERKYTIIQGDSGTGKTLLAVFVEACAAKNKAVQIQCALPVSARVSAFGGISELEQFLAGCSGIAILDENSLSAVEISNLEIARILKKYNVYYILITREAQLFNKVPVSVFDIFRLKNSGRFNTLELVYPENMAGKDAVRVERIITEDSASGCDFMQCYFSDIPVEAAGGKDNIPGKIYEWREDGLFVFYDALSSGFIEDEIWRMVGICTGGVILFRPLCFEKYLLDSPFLKASVNMEEKQPMDGLEAYYEKILGQILPHGYAKGSLPVCLKQDCSVIKKSGYKYCSSCTLQDFKNSKRSLVVYGGLKKIEEG